MPFVPNSPPSVAVVGPSVQKTLDVFHIHNIVIAVDPNNPAATAVRLQYSRGYMDGERYMVGDMNAVTFEGPELLAKVREATTGGTLYGEIRKACWALLRAGDHIPDGAAE